MIGQPRRQMVSQHQFAMVPRNDIPRSAFRVRSTHKTTLQSGWLIPIYVEEVLPGDSIHMSMTAFGRLATLIFPLMDNLYMDTHFFFVPNRLLWDNWEKFMGQQDNPGDSISFLIPVQNSPAGTGYGLGTVEDYMGLPGTGQVTATYAHSALPIRAYKLIYNQWFRDQNLQNSLVISTGNGPDNPVSGTPCQYRAKMPDYFTSALPWPAKSAAVSALTGLAPIQGLLIPNNGLTIGLNTSLTDTARGHAQTIPFEVHSSATTFYIEVDSNSGTALPKVYADLSKATAATVESLRQSFQIQRLLEKDARGGTRYTEIIRSHFGVVSPDARLQRPEYLGGGHSAVNVNPVAQTSVTAATPQGNLAGVGTLVHNSGFSAAFTEHGYIIGLVSVRGEQTYQQGLRKMWSRSTKYDFYWPSFAHLGEQAILIKELYLKGTANDNTVFGYQERYAEYRYRPSQISGIFNSMAAGTLDAWHLGQKFSVQPALNGTFIEDRTPLSRAVAAGAAADGQQVLFDSIFDCRMARAMPMYAVPGLVDHF